MKSVHVVVFSAALFLVGCVSSAPVSYVAPTPDTSDAAYSCALRKLNEIGYTVVNANKEAGFVTAQRQTSGAFAEAMTGKKYSDQLTVSIFDAGDGARKIRVTAAQSAQNAGLMFGKASESAIAPSKSGKSDANVILSACAQGPITTAVGPDIYRAERALAP